MKSPSKNMKKNRRNDERIDNRVVTILTSIGRGYLKAIGKFLTLIILIVLLIAVGIIMVYPLWYLATNHRALFTVIATISIFATIAVIIVMHIYRQGSFRGQWPGRLLKGIRKALSIVAVMVILYGLGVLFMVQPWPAIAGGVVLLGIVGYLRYGRIGR